MNNDQEKEMLYRISTLLFSLMVSLSAAAVVYLIDSPVLVPIALLLTILLPSLQFDI